MVTITNIRSIDYTIFKEIKNGKSAITGGLILHNQNDISKSYYSIHT